jgi:Protein of unknown function (DUF3311)
MPWEKGEFVSPEQGRQDEESRGQRTHGERNNWWLLLLLLPYLGLLYPPLYNHLEPRLWGMSFFIWYQFLWVFITVAITGLVYKVRG